MTVLCFVWVCVDCRNDKCLFLFHVLWTKKKKKNISRISTQALNITSAWWILFFFYDIHSIVESIYFTSLLCEGYRIITTLEKAWTKMNNNLTHIIGFTIKVSLHHVSSELPQFNTTSQLRTIYLSLNVIRLKLQIRINVACGF